MLIQANMLTYLSEKNFENQIKLKVCIVVVFNTFSLCFITGEKLYTFTILTSSSSSTLKWLHGESCLFK